MRTANNKRVRGDVARADLPSYLQQQLHRVLALMNRNEQDPSRLQSSAPPLLHDEDSNVGSISSQQKLDILSPMPQPPSPGSAAAETEKSRSMQLTLGTQAPRFSTYGECSGGEGDAVSSEKKNTSRDWFPNIACLLRSNTNSASTKLLPLSVVALDVRLFGRSLAESPHVFDDAAERLLRDDGGLTATSVAGGLELFVWNCETDCGYEVEAKDVLVLLAWLLSESSVKKILVNSRFLFHLVVGLSGCYGLFPVHCVDLNLLMQTSLYGTLSTDRASNPFTELESLVHESDKFLWDSQCAAKAERLGSDHRHLTSVECRLRTLAAAAAELGVFDVPHYHPGEVLLHAHELDVVAEFVCAQLHWSGLFVDTKSLDENRVLDILGEYRDAFAAIAAQHLHKQMQLSTEAIPDAAGTSVDDVIALAASAAAQLVAELAAETTGAAVSEVGDPIKYLESCESKDNEVVRATASALLAVRELTKVIGEIEHFIFKCTVSRKWNSVVRRSVHPTWLHKVATTGRMFSSRPNVQTLPKKVSQKLQSYIAQYEAKTQRAQSSVASHLLIRSLLCGPPGTCLVSLDYAQMELRVLAHLCGDPHLITLLSRSTESDVFLAIAQVLFGADRLVAGDATQSGSLRQAAKTIVYAVLYGMTQQGIQMQVRSTPSLSQCITDGDASHAIQRFYERFAHVERFLSAVRMTAVKLHEAKGVFRTRKLRSNAGSDETSLRQYEREAVSSVIQGTAADIAKLALAAIQRAMYHFFILSHRPDGGAVGGQDLPPCPCVLVHASHDEFVFAVPIDCRDAAIEYLSRAMVSVGALLKLRVPLAVRARCSTSLV